MAVLFLLLLFLCGLPQAEADSIQAIYVDLGEAPELPCPSPPALHGDEFLSWFRSPAAGSSTALVAHVQVARPSPDPGKPRRESRLKLLGNYSLWLEGPKGRDAGWYWCAVLGQRYRYQNWRVYDVSVLRGSQFSARAADGSSCSVLLCPVTPARSLDAVTWQEGKGPVKGDVQSFWGDGATLLLVCPGEGLPEPRARKPGITLCLVPQNKGISFSLAASTDASPVLYAPSANWDVAWILKLLLTVGQGFTIVVLGVMLWRQRAQGAQHRRNRMRCYDCGGGPSGSCKETVTTCGEGERCGFLERKPQPDLAQTKLSGNPSVTLIHHHPACVAAHHCNQVETEVVGDVTYTTHRDCCVGDLCNGAVASTAAPMSIVAAAVTTLAWLLPGLWRG
ncbi:LOW QUALITY PROTEIN: lymphocyte antigen 6 complex locus protein G6f [Budorcas taxicolor]|uniref:LOW QUALITY PROTEIN: lymphocyte antigen 6 complex locus protein G6f n=1 Tax=Budorcas taxicolor TaxID=37181 RepID=UPI002284A29C|nr:LOW QUALITY PROTEIN: lymphocyte antigen 6 complex locus protein G6f [Budorcas taxicolor]